MKKYHLIFRWLKYWTINKSVKNYLYHFTTQKKSTPWHVYVSIVFVLFQFVHLAWLSTTHPLDELNRLAHSDFTLFWKCSQKINLLPFAMCLQINLLFCTSYFNIQHQTVKSFKLIIDVLYLKSSHTFGREAKSTTSLRIHNYIQFYIKIICYGLIVSICKYILGCLKSVFTLHLDISHRDISSLP